MALSAARALADRARACTGLRWTDLAFSISLANLCYLNVWRDLQGLETGDLDYFRHAPVWQAPVITAVNVLLLSIVITAATTLVRRSRRVLPTVAVVSAARAIVLLLAPLLPVLLLQHVLWSALRSPAALAFDDGRPAPALQQRGPRGPRVLWLLFDEMDERLAFVERPGHLHLPAFDSLRSHAFHAAHAHPPARWTLVSMPSLISGRLFSEAAPIGLDDLQLTLKDSGEKVRWSGQPNVFAEARALGLNTALVGWYHPYCRVLHGSLTRCSWYPYLSAAESLTHDRETGKVDVAQSLWTQATRQLDHMAHAADFVADETPAPHTSWERDEHRRDYQRIRDEVIDELVDNPDFGLILVHWPVPHLSRPPGGRSERPASALTVDDRDEYFENLVLADRALGEMQVKMARADQWAKTIVLVTSDHGFRNEMRSAAVVPFLLKLPGNDQPLEYASPFNTVLTHDLILALLRGEVATTESVARWLDRNRARFAPLS